MFKHDVGIVIIDDFKGIVSKLNNFNYNISKEVSTKKKKCDDYFNALMDIKKKEL